MKKTASMILKQIVSLVSCIAKTKCVAIKDKTSAAKARLLMLAFTKSKKTLMGQDDGDSKQQAMVVYDDSNSSSWCIDQDYDDDDDKYPDLRHSLFDEEDSGLGGSVIDMVKSSKGEDFRLEDEIDHVADLFIVRFHKQMRLQKLQSFKRLQEMLARGL
ncbi:uncharacterized protein LOC126674523 [Mercurialis annua]|uniref:uncharacterized protein LOC126674523 n=1 Tax=Mercurialis annua TaxID=3986 RepID=UPI00215FD086|nr:uncharacterized protein LOC126674523 [Mercurialis annua]